MMNNTELQTLDKQIRSRINELRSLSAEESTEAVKNEDNKGSYDEKEAESVDRQIAEKEKQELALLTANLRWLDSNEGGSCEKCGCEIPYARLRAVPMTRLCIKCAE
ncbi:MAG: DnaK suppressor protein [Gammaproteobacteria bacterium]|jgi:DnaK suppressor protein